MTAGAAPGAPGSATLPAGGTPLVGPAPVGPAGVRSALRRRGFALLFAGQSVSLLGDELYDIGLYWLALQSGPGFLGVVAALTFLPRLVVSVWAGSVVDRSDPRTLMIATDLVRAAAMVVPIASVAAGEPRLLLVAALLVPIASSFFQPARSSIVPDLVAPGELTAANSLLSASGQLAFTIGPALGGVVAAAVGPVHLFSIDGLTFLVSAVSLALIPRALLGVPRRGDGPADDASGEAPVERTHTLANTLDGLRLAWRTRTIRWLLGLQAVDNGIGMGPVLVGLPLLARDVLHGGSAAYGYLMSAYGAGALVGSLAVGMLGERLRKGRAIILGYALVGVGEAALGVVPDLAWVLVVAFLSGVFIPLIVISIPTALQQIVPRHMLGRVFGIHHAVGYGLTSLSVGVAGLLAASVPVAVLLAGAGVVFVGCGALGMLSRDLREMA